MFTEFSEALSTGGPMAAIQTDLGVFITMALAAVLLILLLVMTGNKSRENNVIKPLVYSGVALALATVLSNITLFKMPQGGSITAFSMLFVIIIGYFYGVRQGILAGIVYGLLQLLFFPYVVHPVQMLLDYPLAFGALGLAGIFKDSKFGLVKGVALAIIGRLVMHTLSGVVFFGEYAPEGMNVWLYSFWYNFTYLGVEGGLTILVAFVPGVLSSIDRVKRSALV